MSTPGPGQGSFMALVVDYFSPTILGWHASSVKDTAMVTTALRMPLWWRDHASGILLIKPPKQDRAGVTASAGRTDPGKSTLNGAKAIHVTPSRDGDTEPSCV